jgi:hypothetical protein
MNNAALAQRGREDLLDRADQPGRAVADDQQRGGQAAVFEVGQEGGLVSTGGSN